MKHLGLFAGLGGFELAARWVGWETVAYSEIEKYCLKVLHKLLPDAESLGSITDVDFKRFNGIVDIITGGDPCQPHSVAGNRAGRDDVRFLWPEFRRAYCECQPRIVVNENVAGSISNGVVDQKISDLEADGYTCWPPIVIPAGAGEAIHRRDRVWLVAYSSSTRPQEFDPAAVSAYEAEGHVWNMPFRAAPLRYATGAPDKSGILRMADGLPDRPYRNPRIKALGNAIDPRIAYALFQVIDHYDILF